MEILIGIRILKPLRGGGVFIMGLHYNGSPQPEMLSKSPGYPDIEDREVWGLLGKGDNQQTPKP